MGYHRVVRRTALALLLVALAGCSPKGERLFGPVKEVIGIDGEYFPVSPDKAIPFKGTAADAQAVAMILVAGVPTDSAKWQGRGWFNLHYADDRTLTVSIAQHASVVFMGDDHLQIRMEQLVAILERLTAKK
jgi:hypothetical protein